MSYKLPRVYLSTFFVLGNWNKLDMYINRKPEPLNQQPSEPS